MKRHYRGTARGRFAGLSEQQRDQLRERQEQHNVLRSSFTREGALLYEPTLIKELVRRGFPPYPLTVTVVCVEDLKIRAR